MSHFVLIPNSPDYCVKLCIASGQYGWVLEDLHKLGLEILTTDCLNNLDGPVAYHADMQCCYLGSGKIIVTDMNLPLAQKLINNGFDVIKSSKQLLKQYPNDIALNCLQIKNHVICTPDFADPLICEGKTVIAVKQGYAKCSCAVVDDESVITADVNLATTMQKIGIDVLLINNSFIELDGYDYGFIGGCCGKIASDKLYFTGDILSHPDGIKITEFAMKKGVNIISGSHDVLVDIGGILPLSEKY